MAQKNASSALIADRYIAALFPLAEGEGAVDVVAAELAQLAGLLRENAEFARLATSPVIVPAKKAEMLSALLQGWNASPVVSRFVERLALAGRLNALPEMASAFAARVAVSRGEYAVTITSAKPLSESEKAAITRALGEASGKKITAQVAVDPSLIAGVIVTAGSRRMDYSLAGQLKRLTHALAQPAESAARAA